LCETARVIPDLPYYNEGSTQGQTNQTGSPAPDVFYTLNIPVTGDYTFMVCSDLFDARVQVLGRCIGDFWMMPTKAAPGRRADKLRFWRPASTGFSSKARRE